MAAWQVSVFVLLHSYVIMNMVRDRSDCDPHTVRPFRLSRSPITATLRRVVRFFMCILCMLCMLCIVCINYKAPPTFTQNTPTFFTDLYKTPPTFSYFSYVSERRNPYLSMTFIIAQGSNWKKYGGFLYRNTQEKRGCLVVNKKPEGGHSSG